MFELSKRKRMLIMEQLTSKRERLPSAQRRKIVEQQYNHFVKTMTNFRPAHNSSGVSISDQSKFTEPKSQQSHGNSYLNYSPTIGDIPKPPTDRTDKQKLHSQFYEKEEIENKDEKSPAKMNQVNFFKPNSPQKNQEAMIKDLNALSEQKSQQHSQEKIEDEEIHVPNVNPSIPASSVNNSQAIFFTSQFKNFIDKRPENSSKKEENIEQIKQIQPQKPQIQYVEHASKQQIHRNEKTLRTNKSGQSLVLSNDSSLRFSLNQSAVQEAITKKLTQQLVIDSLGNSVHYSILKKMALFLLIKENLKDFVEFSKEVKVQKEIILFAKKKLLNQMMIAKQMKFQLRKNDIKADEFRNEKDKDLEKNYFKQWKKLYVEKYQMIRDFVQKREAQTLTDSFRALKMLLFDRKISNQIDLYYLSKIFYSFKSVTDKESKRDKQKAYRMYFKNLKKRIFNKFVEGIKLRRRERQNAEIADQNYYFSLIRKGFDSWKQFMPFEERYIKLAMTTNIQLKQTQDKRLIQTRTFDFTEIK